MASGTGDKAGAVGTHGGDYELSAAVDQGVRWRQGTTTVATYFRELEVKSNFRKVLDVRPGEAAVLLRTGQVQEIVTEQRLQVGGFLNRLKGWVGEYSGLSVLMVDTSTFELEMRFGEGDESLRGPGGSRWDHVGPVLVTQDRFEIAARVSCWLQVDLPGIEMHPERVGGFLGLMRGQRTLDSHGLAEVVVDRALNQALQVVVRKHSYEEFRGNEVLAQQIVSKCEVDVAEAMEDCGLKLERLTIMWGWTVAEREEIDAQRAAVLAKELQRKQSEAVAEVERDGELGAARLGAEQTLTSMEYQHGARREEDQRRRDLSHAAATDAVELSRLASEQEIAARALLATKRAKIEEYERTQLAAHQLDLQHRSQQAAIQGQVLSGIIGAAAQAGAVTDETVREAIRALTLQAAVNVGADEAKAVAQAHGGDSRLEAFRAGQQADRGHQQAVLSGVAQVAQGFRPPGMLGFAPLMPQTPAAMAPSGAAPTQALAVEALPAPPMPPPVAGQGRGAASSAPPPRPAAATCSCGASLDPAWKRCPACGSDTSTARTSPCSCGRRLERGWRTCPWCGAEVAGDDSATACRCGQRLESTWARCPSCGEVAGAGAPKRCGCGTMQQPDWTVCPTCGVPAARG